MIIKKKHFTFGGIAILVVVIATALIVDTGYPANQTVDEPSQRVAEGKETYNTYCAECHGIEGEGEYPDAPLEPGPDGLMGAPPHNENGHTWHHDDGLLLQRIREGGRYPGFKPMPAFGETLSDEEIGAVLAYIKTLWTDEQREIQQDVTNRQPQSDIPTIRELFSDD